MASLGTIQMVDVEIPTTDGRVLVLPRYTEPQAEQELLLAKLGLRVCEEIENVGGISWRFLDKGKGAR